MGEDMITEGMLDMFIFETEQGLENLENICLESKDVGEFDEDNVNEIFRIMHTIKGIIGSYDVSECCNTCT